MGLLIKRVYFTSELPALPTVIGKLEQSTAEKIACEYFEDDNGKLDGVEVSSETINSVCTLMLSEKDELLYEILCSVGTRADYLIDALVVVLQALGGTYEYAASLPAAAQQPWQLAKKWYRKS